MNRCGANLHEIVPAPHEEISEGIPGEKLSKSYAWNR